MNDHRDKIKADNPDIKFGEIAKMAGAQWKEMSAEDKQPYEAKAEADKKRYAAEMKAYEQKVAGADDSLRAEETLVSTEADNGPDAWVLSQEEADARRERILRRAHGDRSDSEDDFHDPTWDPPTSYCPDPAVGIRSGKWQMASECLETDVAEEAEGWCHLMEAAVWRRKRHRHHKTTRPHHPLSRRP